MDAEIIGFVSGKGGTGKTTSAVFIGGALAALGKPTVVIEVNTGLRSLDLIAGVDGSTVFDIGDVLSEDADIDKALVKSEAYPGLFLISAPIAGPGIDADSLARVCRALSGQFPYILLDGPPGLGPEYDAVVETARRVVVVSTPDPASLRQAGLVSQSVRRRDKHAYLLLNAVDVEGIQKEGLLTDLDQAIDLACAQLLGVVPQSRWIRYATCLGTALTPYTREQNVYHAVARRLDGAQVPLIVR